MKRLVFFILIIIFSFSASPASILKFTETDYINVRPSAFDQDDDKLTYYFSYPLSSKGTWQTDYGDKGIYNTKVTVSDGRLLTVENITIIISKKEEVPLVELKNPSDEEVYLVEGEEVFFNVEATDLNSDPLTFLWLLDGFEVSTNKFYFYKSNYYSSGKLDLELIVSDGINEVSNEWIIEVEDFNRSILLDEYKSIAVMETELVELDVLDFNSYDLNFNISEPIGNEGKWQTGYDDSGFYNIVISIWDSEGFRDEKEIKVLVENLDRPPRLASPELYHVSEGQIKNFAVRFSDPDDEKVTIVSMDLPPGARYDNNTITWDISYDFVTSNNLLDYVAEKYHVLSRAYDLTFDIISANVSSQEKVRIRVFNKNRAPVLNEIKNIVISEGEIVNFDIGSFDPDNDTISYRYKNVLINRNGFQTKIGDAGTYMVDVEATDGFLSDLKSVRVRIEKTNQPPEFKHISDKSVLEGEELVILMEASDFSEIVHEIAPFPEGAYISGNEFRWTPSYDSVYEGTRVYDLNFSASDGEITTVQMVQISVDHINRPFVINSWSQNKDDYGVGEDVIFSVNAKDPDNDNLTYTWKTGLFTTLMGGESVNINYDTPGKKDISVVVSDGEFSEELNWEIKVTPRLKINFYEVS